MKILIKFLSRKLVARRRVGQYKAGEEIEIDREQGMGLGCRMTCCLRARIACLVTCDCLVFAVFGVWCLLVLALCCRRLRTYVWRTAHFIFIIIYYCAFCKKDTHRPTT